MITGAKGRLISVRYFKDCLDLSWTTFLTLMAATFMSKAWNLQGRVWAGALRCAATARTSSVLLDRAGQAVTPDSRQGRDAAGDHALKLADLATPPVHCHQDPRSASRADGRRPLIGSCWSAAIVAEDTTTAPPPRPSARATGRRLDALLQELRRDRPRVPAFLAIFNTSQPVGERAEFYVGFSTSTRMAHMPGFLPRAAYDAVTRSALSTLCDRQGIALNSCGTIECGWTVRH